MIRLTRYWFDSVFSEIPQKSPKEYQEAGYCGSCFGEGEIERFGFPSVICSTCKGTGDVPHKSDGA